MLRVQIYSFARRIRFRFQIDRRNRSAVEHSPRRISRVLLQDDSRGVRDRTRRVARHCRVPRSRWKRIKGTRAANEYNDGEKWEGVGNDFVERAAKVTDKDRCCEQRESNERRRTTEKTILRKDHHHVWSGGRVPGGDDTIRRECVQRRSHVTSPLMGRQVIAPRSSKTYRKKRRNGFFASFLFSTIPSET